MSAGELLMAAISFGSMLLVMWFLHITFKEMDDVTNSTELREKYGIPSGVLGYVGISILFLVSGDPAIKPRRARFLIRLLGFMGLIGAIVIVAGLLGI